MEQLLKREPDVVVALGALAALSAQRATSLIPILYAIVLDPRDVGLTAANVSGITTFDPDQAMRHVRLMQHVVPGLRRLACLTDVHAPRAPNGRNPLLSQIMAAAAAQGLDLDCISLDGVDADLDAAFETARDVRSQALVVLEVPAVLARLDEIARSAERLRLPTLAPYGGSQSGVVMQGTALQDAIDPLSAYVAALHRGASLAALPLRTVRHERLVIHCGRAGRTGLAVPQAVLDRATRCLGCRRDRQPPTVPAAVSGAIRKHMVQPLLQLDDREIP
jgi:putative ABC transport system substrate-binding protein